MEKSRTAANERRKRNAELRAAAWEAKKLELDAQLAALRKIRDSEEATPAERLEAVKMIAELNR